MVRNSKVELQLIATRSFMRINIHYFFFPFGFVCIKSLIREIYLYKSLKRWIYTNKFLINSYHFNSSALLFPPTFTSPPRTFSLSNIQERCTLNNKRRGVNHEIISNNYTNATSTFQFT